MDKNSNIRKLINQDAEVLKEDKNLRKKFNQDIFAGLSDELLKNEKFKDVAQGLQKEFSEILMNKNDKKFMFKAIEKHFKQGFMAKWAKNVLFQGLKLKTKVTLEKANAKMPPDMEEWLKINYKNYSTLWNTAGVLTLPGLAALIAVPYSFNAWLTNIQKKAGKIGIMKAMEQVDDDRVFVKSSPNFVYEQPRKTNLLDKFKTA